MSIVTILNLITLACSLATTCFLIAIIRKDKNRRR